ncbi:tetratricopeptide repeat-containing protein [Entamoeba nuttalli P19]|uniref:Tetratricopeptide repeat-containing protein n=1 Tax=Entamoeba nuttalli (strain P19) TaxID=1076696 RepID=K2GFF6_ENTNP|nr:tetratricopeptide repeat-containing protein [Entamoeba nuttalli P19]EKE41411.1 tetratricopeptide repeat-containing protein [Entamoeba nuttalli P19]|eukprot:XP_008856260.1 tetratricopeptide repeat-containing protein [Entamoeba nuttalli P19]
MSESYYEQYLRSNNPNEFKELKKRLEESNDEGEQKVINQSNIALLELLTSQDYNQYITTILPLETSEPTYLLYNKAVGLLRVGKPTDALSFLSESSNREEESQIKLLSLILYYCIVSSMGSITFNLERITDEFINPIYVPGTINYIESQLILMKKSIHENNIPQAISHINCVCNSCRDITRKPYYQALFCYLNNDFDGARDALYQGESPLKDIGNACTFARSGKPAVAIYMLQKAFHCFDHKDEPMKSSLEEPATTLYPIGWKQTTTYNLGLCYLLENKPIEAHAALITLVDYYRYNPLLWYRLACSCIQYHYNYIKNAQMKYQYVGTASARHVLLIQQPLSPENSQLPLSLGMQYIRNMTTLLRTNSESSVNHKLVLAMYYAMGYISYWSGDYLLAKYCWEKVYASKNNQLRISALSYLVKTYCFLQLPKESEKILQDFFVSKPQENNEDVNYASAMALVFMGKYEDALKVVDKMLETPETDALKVFILLNLNRKDLAAAVVRKSSPIQVHKNVLFINYD